METISDNFFLFVVIFSVVIAAYALLPKESQTSNFIPEEDIDDTP